MLPLALSDLYGGRNPRGRLTVFLFMPLNKKQKENCVHIEGRENRYSFYRVIMSSAPLSMRTRVDDSEAEAKQII